MSKIIETLMNLKSENYQITDKYIMYLISQQDFTWDQIQELRARCLEEICNQRNHELSNVKNLQCDCGFRSFEDVL